MYQYDKMCLEVFLEKQLQLFPEKVAETMEEAEDFLEMSMAVVCKDKKEVHKYLDEAGVDLSELNHSSIENLEEVFSLPDGRFLVVEI